MRWAFYLAMGIVIWLIGALLVTFYLDAQGDAVQRSSCIASGVYLFILLFVMAFGNFGRVRLLLVLQILYSLGVLYRAVVGAMAALLLIEGQLEGRTAAFLDALVRPLAGFRYIAGQLTSHFVAEIYWLGLALSATMLVFLASLSIMAVGSRIGRERALSRRSEPLAAPKARSTAAIAAKRK